MSMWSIFAVGFCESVSPHSTFKPQIDSISSHYFTLSPLSALAHVWLFDFVNPFLASILTRTQALLFLVRKSLVGEASIRFLKYFAVCSNYFAYTTDGYHSNTIKISLAFPFLCLYRMLSKYFGWANWIYDHGNWHDMTLYFNLCAPETWTAPDLQPMIVEDPWLMIVFAMKISWNREFTSITSLA